MSDTLSRVLLSASAVERWHALARDIASTNHGAGVDAASIPDELARVEADGSLTIYVTLPTGAEVSMRVEPSEWSWIEGARSQ